MLKLKRNTKGFTLMEMLIVVAIIAILVAIAIPTFTSSLKKAKVGADQANIRSAYAEAINMALTSDDGVGTSNPIKLQTASSPEDELVLGSYTLSWSESDAATITAATVGEDEDGEATITADGGITVSHTGSSGGSGGSGGSGEGEGGGSGE